MSDISVKICDVIKQSVNEAFSLEVEDQMVMVERPRDPKMGDYSTNIAMRLAKSLHKKPVDIANELVEVLKKNLSEASEISVAGPGFINFKISESALSACIVDKILCPEDIEFLTAITASADLTSDSKIHLGF